MRKLSLLLGLLLTGALVAGVAAQPAARRVSAPRAVVDVHSYSNPGEVRVRHVDLDWDVLFDQKILKGTATLTVERAGGNRRAPLILDTRSLGVTRAETSAGGATWSEAQFTIGAADAILGAPLTIDCRRACRKSASITRPAPARRACSGSSRRRRRARSTRSCSRSRRRSTRAAGSRCRTRRGVRVTYTARDPHAAGAARGDERATTTPRAPARRRLPLRDAAADPVVPDRARRRRPRVPPDRAAHGRLRRAVGRRARRRASSPTPRR